MKLCTLATLLLLSLTAQAQTYTYSTLATPGTGAYGALAIHNNVLYGYANGGTHGYGLIFSLTTAGKLTTLYNFGATSTDGKNPVGAPNYQSTTGDLYGITTAGGRPRHGTLFKLTPKNKETTVYAWAPYWYAWFSTEPSMVMDSSGNLYGIFNTNAEGSGGEYGEQFGVTQAGVVTDFGTCGGEQPAAGMIIKGTTLYGATTNGGATASWGSIYSLTTTGVCTLLYSFTDGNDGAYPYGKLTQNAAGVLFGTASIGGACNEGTVWSFDPATSVFTTLYGFCGNGGYPLGPVILDSAGNLYGAADGGVFELTPEGIETVLYTGGSSEDSLVMDTSGNLYGIGPGSVFKLTKN